MHPFPPLYDENSRILILGSFPSVKSREENFFYGHPQNRFWKVISAILGCRCPRNIGEKKEMLLSAGIALWDVIASCDISGSADSSIKNVTVNDIDEILRVADIGQIFTNGRTAEKYFNRYTKADRKSLCLPSTSPANAAWTAEMLIEKWKIIADYL